AGANERCELRCAGFVVREGTNAVRPGIAAVSAQLENGTLRVLEGRCPNLLAEAALYRYSADPHDSRAEVPVDEHNHALAALRYLTSQRDAGHMARARPAAGRAAVVPAAESPAPSSTRASRRPWLRLDNEALWTTLGTIHRDLS